MSVRGVVTAAEKIGGFVKTPQETRHPDDGSRVKEGCVVTSAFEMTASRLAVTDRCDRCGAQAYVRATLESGLDLLFCAHHWRDNESRLRAVGAQIHDETTRLVEVRPTAALDER
jgi:hypothetical protein